MRNELVGVLTCAVLICGCEAHGQSDTALDSQLKEWVSKVQDKAELGQRDEKDYADLLHQADDILAQHKTQETKPLVQLLMLETQIYAQLVTNAGRFDKATACVQRVKKEFPDTPPGQAADQVIAQLTQAGAMDKIYSSLTPGVTMPDFKEQDSRGQPLSLSAHKGKLVLLDFWATWCPPCMAEFPNVKKIYGDFHDKGLDVIGVDLDDDRGKFDSFIQERGVAWPQYYDGQGWSNKLVAKYGISSIPATFLIDTNGVIVAKEVSGKALSDAVAAALAGK